MAGENRTPKMKIGEVAHAEEQAARTTEHQSAQSPSIAEREQRVREKAYQLWEADGAPQGKAEHYWYRAQEFIKRDGAAKSSRDQTIGNSAPPQDDHE